MSRPTSRKKSDVSKRVVELRSALGDTQQSFATRLGVAVTTVARWETMRPPSGEMLSKLAVIAQEHGADTLCDYFQTKYVDQWEDPGYTILAIAPHEERPAQALYRRRVEGGRLVNAVFQCDDILTAIQLQDEQSSIKIAEELEDLARRCRSSNSKDEAIRSSLIAAYATGRTR